MHDWATGNGVASAKRKVMNHLPLIRKNLCMKKQLHDAELFLASRPSHSIPTELNHTSKCSSSSTQLNSHLAKRVHEIRLNSVQITSKTK